MANIYDLANELERGIRALPEYKKAETGFLKLQEWQISAKTRTDFLWSDPFLLNETSVPPSCAAHVLAL